MAEGEMDFSQNPEIQKPNPTSEKPIGKNESLEVSVTPDKSGEVSDTSTSEGTGNNRGSIEKYTEERGLSNLIDRYSEKLGGYEIHQVGDAGYLLQSKNQIPMAGNDWFLFDYDDTLRGTTEVKEKRLDLYKDYARSVGVQVPDDVLQHLMETTDKFARWEDTEGGGSSYHANTHMSTLHWVTENLKSVTEEKSEEAVSNIEGRLQRIKTEIEGGSQQQEDDPFYFRDNKFILKSKFWYPEGVLTPWSDGIKDLFMQSMMNPPDYPASVQAMGEIGQPKDSIHRVNMGIFTYGQPYYQLLKVFELLKENPDTPINQIWLTKVPKGRYIEELVTSGVNRETQMEYVSSTIPGGSLDSEEGGISMGSGYPLGEHPHVMVMMDDNPKELNSILDTNKFLAEKTGASFAVVRSRGGGGRETDKEWAVNAPHGEIDFRNKKFTAQEVALTLKATRYLNYKGNLGPENPRVKAMEAELRELGADDQLLMPAS